MTERMESMVVAVTGGAGALGAATARRLAAQGARVVLGGRRLAPLHALAAEIAAAGGEVRFFALDAAQPRSLAHFAANARAAFGRLDLLVHGVRALPLAALALPPGVRAVLPHALAEADEGGGQRLEAGLPVPALPPPDARPARVGGRGRCRGACPGA